MRNSCVKFTANKVNTVFNNTLTYIMSTKHRFKVYVVILNCSKTQLTLKFSLFDFVKTEDTNLS